MTSEIYCPLHSTHLAPSVRENWPFEVLNLDSLHDLPVEGLLEGSGHPHAIAIYTVCSGDDEHYGARALTCLRGWPRGSQGAPHLSRKHSCQSRPCTLPPSPRTCHNRKLRSEAPKQKVE